MNVLDPFEVAEIEMWPFWSLQDAEKALAEEIVSRAEYTVFCQAIRKSAFGKVLNEREPEPAEEIELPSPIRVSILPPDLRRKREHPDVRIARRAQTIANLARVISERQVRIGLRQTLLAQAQRLEELTNEEWEGLDGSQP